VGDSIKWYVHAWGSDNSYSDSPAQACTAGVTSGPTLCNLVCVPESLMVRASIKPRGFGTEIRFVYTHDGSDPKIGENAYAIEGSWLADENSPGGDCPDSVGTFFANLYAKQGETIKWYAYGWYQPDNKYNGLFGETDVQTCVADTTRTGVDPKTTGPAVSNLASVPNPFGASTQIRFTLSRKSKVTILAYDIRGRMVARVFDGMLPEGRNAINWDGTDSLGRQVSSGVYFYRLVAGDFVSTRKMVVLK